MNKEICNSDVCLLVPDRRAEFLYASCSFLFHQRCMFSTCSVFIGFSAELKRVSKGIK